MRWYSTIKSTDNLEFTVLAAIESILAVSLILWLALKYQTVLHIVIAVLIAPLLLMRTKKTTERSLRYLEWTLTNKPLIVFFYFIFPIILIVTPIFLWQPALVAISYITIFLFFLLVIMTIERRIDGYHTPFLWFFWGLTIIIGVGGGVALAVSIIVGLAAGSFLIKVIATVQTFVQSPFSSLRKIPANWFRIVFCMDSLHPPELIPGIENIKNNSYSIDLTFLKFGKWFSGIRANYPYDDWPVALYARSTLYLVTPILYFPALAYRWSLKSSSIIWLPLIWIIGHDHENSFEINQQLQSKLEILRHTAWAKITAIYAFVVIFLMTAFPLLLRVKAIVLTDNLNFTDDEVLLDNLLNFFFAFQMQAWHWSRLFAAILTLILFFYADRLLIKRNHNQKAGLDYAPYLIRFFIMLRIPLSLFTIICGLYLLLNPIDWQELFRNIQWLPFDFSHDST